MKIGWLVATLSLWSAAFLTSSAALSVEKPPKDNIPRAQGPFFDPESKSYFELRIDNHLMADGVRQSRWSEANIMAAQKSYKGRQGRLAIVKDARTLEFLSEHFRFNEPAWIGMRFYCKFRKLIWVNGDIQPLGTPGMWHRKWHWDRVRCTTERIPYMPVFLTSHSQGGTYWQATGPSKYFVSYIVEYPAPEHMEKQSSGEGITGNDVSKASAPPRDRQ